MNGPAPAWLFLPAARAAVAAGQYGTVLRLARTAAGLTLHDAGRLAGYSAATLSRLERGIQPLTDVRTLRHLATVFAIPPAAFGLADPGGTTSAATIDRLPHRPTMEGDPARAQPTRLGTGLGRDVRLTPVREDERTLAGAGSSTAELMVRFVQEDLALDRREATRAIAGLVLGAALLERVESWLSPTIGLAEQRRRSAIGTPEVEQIEQAARFFKTDGKRLGVGLWRTAVAGQLAEVAAELRDFAHPPALACRLHGAMAVLAATAAGSANTGGDRRRRDRTPRPHYRLGAAPDRTHPPCGRPMTPRDAAAAPRRRTVHNSASRVDSPPSSARGVHVAGESADRDPVAGARTVVDEGGELTEGLDVKIPHPRWAGVIGELPATRRAWICRSRSATAAKVRHSSGPVPCGPAVDSVQLRVVTH